MGRIAVACALIALGCAGAPGPEPPSRSSLDLDGWTGGEAPRAPEVTQPAAPLPAAIELARGERFESLLALTSTAVPNGVTCALYSIRMTDAGLQEGQRAVACPAGGLSGLDELAIAFRDVEEQRWVHVAAALAGAEVAPGPEHPTEPDPHPAHEGDQVELRVVTSARSLEARVTQPRWPTPYAEHDETPRGTPPANASELWEAVMFPHRYAAVPR